MTTTSTQPITLSDIARLVAEANDLREQSWDHRWQDYAIDVEQAVDHVLHRQRLGFNDTLRAIVMALATNEDAVGTCGTIADTDTAAQRGGVRPAVEQQAVSAAAAAAA